MLVSSYGVRRATTRLIPALYQTSQRHAPTQPLVPQQRNTLCTSKQVAKGSLSVLLDIPPLKSSANSSYKRNAKTTEQAPAAPRPDVDLFDAIVHEGIPVQKIRSNFVEACLNADGSAAPIRVDEKFIDQLNACVEQKNAHGAFAVLQQIIDDGYKPTASAYLRVIETCAVAREFDLAEDARKLFTPVFRKYERRSDIMRSARTSIALAHLSCGSPHEALHLLNYPFGSVKSPRELIDAMDIGSNPLTWGCIVRALTAIGEPELAVDVSREAYAAGLPSSDSMTFFLLEALRASGRWQDADAVFQASLASGVTPHERTVGSLLRTLTLPAARRFVDVDRIEQLARMPKEPTARFRTVALIAASSVGRVDLAHEMYAGLEEAAAPNPPDERSSSILIGAYSSLVESGAPPDVIDVEKWHEQVVNKIDVLWAKFEKQIRSKGRTSRLPPRMRDARSRAFQRYLWTKSRCLCCADAARALEDALGDRRFRSELNISVAHFAAVLSGCELTCNVDVLQRVLQLMHEECIQHDPRTLAFAIGALLGQGYTSGAVALVRAHGPAIRSSVALSRQRDYRVSLLLRRLDLLADSVRETLCDNKVNRELWSLSSALENHLRSSSTRPGSGWR